MKGIVLLIYEPPNNRRVIFNQQSYNSQPLPQKEQQQALVSLFRKFPQLIGEDGSSSIYNRRGSLEENYIQEDQDKNYFGFSKAFFTELFIPKETIFKNNLFDLAVEENRFLSYPYFFDDSSIQGKKQSKKENKGKNHNEGQQNQEQSEENKNKTTKDNRNVFYKDEGGQLKVKAINVIFVLDSYDIDSIQRIDYYAAILQTLTLALAREQIRESFIGKQSYKILRMKQQAFESKAKTFQAKQTLKNQILQESLLAQHIRDVFDSFYFRKTKLIKINRWVQFQINQMPNYQQIKMMKREDASDESNEYVKGPLFQKAEQINVLPNQTLLLFNAKQTLQQLPDDCSPILAEAIKIINPLKSLSQLCVDHCVAYSEMLKVARHFVFWNQAKIIYPISLKEVYVLSNNNEHLRQDIAQKFNQKFYQFDKITFEKTLSMFSLPEKLEVHFQNLKMTLKDFINMVIYLLQHNIIEERCLYIVLKLPSQNKDLKLVQQTFFDKAYEIITREQRKSHSALPKSRSPTDAAMRTSSLFAAPKSSIANQNVINIEDYLDVVRNDSDNEFRLLERMYPFFTGEFNHHDIMMISNCTRGKIDRMLDKYSCVLEKFWLK